MPCFGKTCCYISKTIHSVRVFRRFLLWSRDRPNMGVVRNSWRKCESNKHGKLWCSLEPNKGGFEISLATDSNRLEVKFSIFSSRCFPKEKENMYSVFLSSYTNTRESFGELEKIVETLACSSCSTAFLVFPNFHSCLHNSITEARYMFSIS